MKKTIIDLFEDSVVKYGAKTFLLEKKHYDMKRYERHGMKGTDFRLREELADQMKALNEMKEMAASYGVDISKPAKNAKEAVQAVYMGYLAGTKENNGAAYHSISQYSVCCIKPFSVYIE